MGPEPNRSHPQLLAATLGLGALALVALPSCAKRADPQRRAGAKGAAAPREAGPKAERKADEAADRAADKAPAAAAGPARPAGSKKHRAPGAAHPFGGLRVVHGAHRAGATFRHYGVNPTIDTDEERVSSFAVDVDTASFTLARASLERGHLPPPAAIRVEEFVNAFDYGYRPPRPGDAVPFSVHVEVLPSPHRRGYHVLRLGLKGREVPTARRRPANLVFVIGRSGAPGMPSRMPLVKRALTLLVSQLRPSDRLAIVTYGAKTRVVLPSTPGSDRARLLEAIAAVRPGGATGVQAGIRLGYGLAREHQRPGTISRVILCSDGVATSGVTSADGILQEIQGDVQKGITLTVVGFGLGRYNDALLERLANRANGSYHYVDRLAEARRVFLEKLTGTLQIIAEDVKVQVEFDPRAVARYRLLGYENRRLGKRAFADDRKDAGELGAGHAVTALYEVRLKARRGTAPLGVLRVRYKAPRGSRSQLLQQTLPAPPLAAAAAPSPAARLALVVAAFAEKLRGSYWVRTLRYEALLAQLDPLPAPWATRADVKTLRRLIETARRLDRRGDRYARIVPADRMSFDRVPVLR